MRFMLFSGEVTVVCPYGRLQSVLLDRNSMIVAYDYKRGEPRGKYKKEKVAEKENGDCIDCFQCVKVCPTGIDIGNGTQMECVGCTACIDACDKMMDAVNRPRGLVRYASENGIEEGKKLSYTGRMKFYTLLLLILTPFPINNPACNEKRSGWNNFQGKRTIIPGTGNG